MMRPLGSGRRDHVSWSPRHMRRRRSDGWRKLKADYVDGEGLCDSLDLVPIGAWRGNGRKSEWFSPWLMAVYDPPTTVPEPLPRHVRVLR